MVTDKEQRERFLADYPKRAPLRTVATPLPHERPQPAQPVPPRPVAPPPPEQQPEPLPLGATRPELPRPPGRKS